MRDTIAGWAQGVVSRVAWPDLPAQIADRDADVWEPLIAVADAAGGSWPHRSRVAAVALVAQSKEVEPSLGIRLLKDLRLVFGTADEMPSKILLEALNGLKEAPWSDIKGKPLDERGLAGRLAQYGVKSKTIRISATSTIKGYARGDLVDVWARYIPAQPTTRVTSVTAVTRSAVNLHPHRAHSTPPVSLVTHVTPPDDDAVDE